MNPSPDEQICPYVGMSVSAVFYINKFPFFSYMAQEYITLSDNKCFLLYQPVFHLHHCLSINKKVLAVSFLAYINSCLTR